MRLDQMPQPPAHRDRSPGTTASAQMRLRLRLRAAAEALRDRGWAMLRDLPFIVDGHADERAVLSIATVCGLPSSRDGGRPVWPVRPAPSGRGTTFSSRAGSAGVHTDAQYRRVPEEFICLFVVRAASSGGLTRLLAAADAAAAI